MPSYNHVLIVDVDHCVNCGTCREWCLHGAIEQKQGHVEINEYECTRCDRCIEPCPTNCIDSIFTLQDKDL